MRRVHRVILPHHIPEIIATWLSAAYSAARAYLTGWNAAGTVPAIVFLEEAERFRRSDLPDPEAYTHALGAPASHS